MHAGTRKRQIITRSTNLTFRLTADEKTALENRADDAGLTLSEYCRKLVLQALSPTIDSRTQEMLRVMGDIVQQKTLKLLQSATKITDEKTHELEREAAGLAHDWLDRRLHLLGKVPAPQKL